MTIQTFSGTHPWHPSVLVDTDADAQGNADDIIYDIEHGLCPRCEGPLQRANHDIPAGSRITQCRSIPICYRCGDDEKYEALDAATGQGWGGISAASCWPLPIEEIEERKLRYEKHAVPAILAFDRKRGVLVTEDGVSQVVNPRNTGGWAQYGDGAAE